MREVLSEAGRSFLRAFGGSLLVLVPGFLSAPDLNAQKSMAVAALIASVVSGIKAVQVFIPRLSFAELVGEKWGVLVDSAARAFLGAVFVLLPGVLYAPNLSESKGLLVAALIAGVTAVVRVLQGFFPEVQDPQEARAATE